MAANMTAGAHGRDITAAEAAWSPQRPAAPIGPVTFHRVLQALNPLQYLPVVGSIYRVATGDEGSPTLRTVGSLVGGALMGGPVGVVTSIVGILAEHFFHFEQVARSVVAPAAGSGGGAAAAPPGPAQPDSVHSAAIESAAVHPAAPSPIAPAPPLAARAVAARAVAAYARVGDLPMRIAWGGRET